MQLNHGCLLQGAGDSERAQAAHLCSSCHILQLDIPVVLGICQFSPIQLTTLQLHLQEQDFVLGVQLCAESNGCCHKSAAQAHRQDMAFRFMQQLHWDAHSFGGGHPWLCNPSSPATCTAVMPALGPPGGPASLSTAAGDIIQEAGTGHQAW